MAIRVAVIDRDVCIKQKCGYVCAKVCPPNRMGDECIIVEKDTEFPAISEPLCIGCGLCVKKCPVQCISVINLAQELTDPIFQYGVNTFRLYGLPLPVKGAASIIGKNGIGKTTAIKILSRQMTPNFAMLNLGRELSDEEVNERLAIETRRYFMKTKEGLKVSVKPQYIDKIRDAFKGSVRELLGSLGSAAEVKANIEKFEISDILERKISQLSGGELQKVAIAAACMKEADIYYFDEVTNFLDIEERLRAAVILKALSERRNVLLAEHDMTILDYVSDYVYLVYGDENVYGIVSQIKNARAGINEYIGGYLKEENVRFRATEIAFSRHSEGGIRAPSLLKYEKLAKKYTGFSFSSDAGEIKKGEILGLVGKNALGKSLFVKVLSGVEKPDKGHGISDISGTRRISYKPQYISAEPVVVAELFGGKDLDGSVL